MVPLQTFPAEQVVPLQQVCPAAPQGAQRWSRPHVSPVPHAGVERWQHACPAKPQATQRFAPSAI